MVNDTRKALESLYIGTFNSFIFQEVTDPITKQTTEIEVAELTNQPCRLSYNLVSPLKYRYENKGIPEISQVIKLFCAPEVRISPGSVLEITQNGFTARYKHSGVPAVHSNHQEIILEYGGSNER